MNSIVVLADDVSGAAELAAIAAASGFTAEVQLEFDPACEADVCCVDLNTRALPEETAVHRWRAAARRIHEAKPSAWFKKVDSVLRGHVVAETIALLAVTAHPRAALVSANPSRGRVIRGGRYFVDGIPLDQTVFARDPDHPRRTAHVRELLGRTDERIGIPDIETLDDVEQRAAALAGDTLPVGGADFFAAFLRHCGVHRTAASGHLAEARATSGADLFVCGSPAAWQTGRRRDCELNHIPIFRRDTVTSAVVAALESRGCAMLAGGQELHTRETAPAALDELAEQAIAILGQTHVRRLFLEGGATARRLIEVARWNRLAAATVIETGLVALRPQGSAGPEIIIKPGSYPWPSAIWAQLPKANA